MLQIFEPKTMKNIKISLLVVAIFMLSAPLFGQKPCKIGHLNSAEIYQIMPGVDTIQQKIADYRNELLAVGEDMQKEFQAKYAEYEQKMATYSAAVAKIKEDELTAMYKRLEEFSQTAEEDLQNKELELLQPVKDKLLKIIAEVAEEGAFTYIFDTSTLLFYENGEDISAQVKSKLGIK